LFEPSLHGIEFAPGLSLCPRGWFGVYDLQPRLVLRRLHVRLTDDAGLVPLAGICPQRRRRRTHQLVGRQWQLGEWPSWDHVYRDLEVPCRFTGSLWLGADPVDARGATEPLLTYRSVWDVLFEDGQLTAAIDRSSEVAGARAVRLRAEPGPPVVFDQLH
ncbi:MAG: hypothetical protein AAF602_33625, partial [Myxococcota bacterium]